MQKDPPKPSNHTVKLSHGVTKKFDAKEYVRPGLTLEQVMEVKKNFDLFDIDMSGAIDMKCTHWG